MSQNLVAFVGLSPQEDMQWRIVDSRGGTVNAGQGELDQLPRNLGGSIHLVLPGQAVSTICAHVAAKSDKQLRSAAPYAIEDELARELDDVHVSIGPKRTLTDERVFWIADHAVLELWREALAGVGLSIRSIHADHMLSPSIQDKITYVDRGDAWLVKYDEWSASIDKSLGEPFLEAVCKQAFEAVHEDADTQSWDTALTEYQSDDVISLLASRALEQGPSLLQGDYQRGAEQTGSAFDFDKWKLPIGLATAAAFTVISFAAAEGAVLRAKTNDLRQETESAFKAAFPQVSRVRNLRAQLRQQMANQGGVASGEFLVLSGLLANAVNTVEGVTVQSLRYDQQLSELQASVSFSSYQDMSLLKSTVEEAGGVVREGGSRQSGGERVGEITVTTQ